MSVASNQRINPYTQAAMDAVANMQAVLDDVIAKYSIPLGQQIVPASTRRDRQQRHAQELADVLFGLSQQFGEDEVQEVLGLPAGPGEAGGESTMLEALINQYGQETVQRAFSLLALHLRQVAGTPGQDQYLPEASGGTA